MRGRKYRTYDRNSRGYSRPREDIQMAVSTLDGTGPSGFDKIFCKCGRIVGFDSQQVALKNMLNKCIECPVCRNERISRDIEEMNNYFDNIVEEEC